jgi:hypothetical protein
MHGKRAQVRGALLGNPVPTITVKSCIHQKTLMDTLLTKIKAEVPASHT